MISNLNKAFESRVRLGIMSMLVVNDWVDFNTFKEILEITDGNLASHLKALEEKEMIEIRKQFVGRKPKTSYKVTEFGKQQFKQHITAFEELIKNQ